MNKVSTLLLFRLLFASVLILLSVSGVKAETTNCTEITALPAIITVQGVYCFKADLVTSMTSGNAIDIQTNNVTIDMNGFKLGGLGAGAATLANGVYALNRKNIILRNANIRGFLRGVLLEDTSAGKKDSGGHIIEDSRIEGNRKTGIEIFGSGNSVRRNQILSTGGSTVGPGATGISGSGPGFEVIDNHVHNTFSSSSFNVYGISLSLYSDPALVLRNRVSETTAMGGGIYGIFYAIFPTGGTRVLIQDNQIVNSSTTGTTAIYGSKTQWCLAVNNTLINFTTFIDDCTDGGGNTTF